MANLYRRVECPYCGVEQSVGGDHGEKKLIYCDNEIGGCDKLFAIEIWHIAKIITYKVEEFRRYEGNEVTAKRCEAPVSEGEK